MVLESYCQSSQRPWLFSPSTSPASYSPTTVDNCFSGFACVDLFSILQPMPLTNPVQFHKHMLLSGITLDTSDGALLFGHTDRYRYLENQGRGSDTDHCLPGTFQQPLNWPFYLWSRTLHPPPPQPSFFPCQLPWGLNVLAFCSGSLSYTKITHGCLWPTRDPILFSAPPHTHTMEGFS